MNSEGQPLKLERLFSNFLITKSIVDMIEWPTYRLAYSLSVCALFAYCHAVKDANGRSYNRTQYLKQRFEQIQQWADYLDKLAKGADVIQFKAA